MSGWQIRLEGGPADGDTAETELEPPERLWVAWCEAHGTWHWYGERVDGGERYRKSEEEVNALRALFIYEDLLDTLPLQTGRERVPVAG